MLLPHIMPLFPPLIYLIRTELSSLKVQAVTLWVCPWYFLMILAVRTSHRKTILSPKYDLYWNLINMGIDGNITSYWAESIIILRNFDISDFIIMLSNILFDHFIGVRIPKYNTLYKIMKESVITYRFIPIINFQQV
jgi:hypothetical protein